MNSRVLHLSLFIVLVFLIVSSQTATIPSTIQNLTLKKLWEKELGAEVWSVSWSPDGSKLAVGGTFNKTIVFGVSSVQQYEGDVYGLSAVYNSSNGTVNYSWRVNVSSGTGTWKVILQGYSIKESFTLDVATTPYETEMRYTEPIKVDKDVEYPWCVELYGPNNELVDRQCSNATIQLPKPPIAVFDYRPKSPRVGEKVTFDASTSYDPDGSIVLYRWDFDDGTILKTNMPVVTHVYNASGTFTVTLTVVDDDDLNASASAIIKVLKSSSNTTSTTTTTIANSTQMTTTSLLFSTTTTSTATHLPTTTTFQSTTSTPQTSIVSYPIITTTTQSSSPIKTTITTTISTTKNTKTTTMSSLAGGVDLSVFPPGFTTLLAPIGIGVGLATYIILRRRDRGTSEEIVVDKYGPSSSSGAISSSRTKSSLSSEAVLGLSSVRELLFHRLQGLVDGYGCLGEGFEVKFSKSIVPKGFEGSWTCCRLGCGGWGCAYKCEQDERVVVFKVPRGFESIIEGGIIPTVDMYLLKKIVSEAETVKSLKHPNILKLLNYSDRAPILVYEYADHGSLEWQIVNGWKPSLRDIVLIGIQVGDTLRYIHSRGLVHGDIKPGNIFISGGVAKVGDFSSLVKLVTMTSRHSRLAYTPGFRAPEQAYADLRREAVSMGVESRIDTYQLGNLLLYLLTHEALDGEDAVKPGAVEEAVNKIDHPGLRGVVRKTLTPNPLQRPSTEEIVKELLRIWKELEDKQ
ncbi:MAG: PKD domain-containing protein [Staphylothermus sp.]|nr:PKD domain-containing protein [Staphylothermus sp.]